MRGLNTSHAAEITRPSASVTNTTIMGCADDDHLPIFGHKPCGQQPRWQIRRLVVTPSLPLDSLPALREEITLRGDQSIKCLPLRPNVPGGVNEAPMLAHHAHHWTSPLIAEPRLWVGRA